MYAPLLVISIVFYLASLWYHSHMETVVAGKGAKLEIFAFSREKRYLVGVCRLLVDGKSEIVTGRLWLRIYVRVSDEEGDKVFKVFDAAADVGRSSWKEMSIGVSIFKKKGKFLPIGEIDMNPYILDDKTEWVVDVEFDTKKFGKLKSRVIVENLKR